MKNAKKFASLLLALIMVFALAAPTFAAGDTYTITINNEASGHTYTAYQVFSGDLSNGTLSNIQWGANIDKAKNAELIAAIKDVEGFASLENTATASDVAVILASKTNDAEAVREFAKAVKPYTTTSTDQSTYVAATGSAKAHYTISGLEAGYYLVVDSDVSGYDATSAYILAVVDNTTVTPKTGVPTVEKKVKDVNDSTGETTGWQKSADYDIGDDVPFQLTATLGDISRYSTYSITFNDTLSEGLTLNSNSVKVYYKAVNSENRTEVTSGFITTPATDGHSFTLAITNVKAAPFNATSNDQIIVEYTAKLNEKAVVGNPGNPNDVTLTFSNNPNGSGTGETPKDTVVVFTYELDVNKVKERVDGEALKGAGFTLFKKDSSGNFNKIGEEVKGADLTTFTWKGLDDGTYRLEETTTPPGYNTIEPIIFNITAEHDKTINDATGRYTLTALSATVTDDSPTKADFTAVTNQDGGALTGVLTTNVVNRSGSTLPGTGGIGTTIFYIVGSVLLVGAAVLLITKKRVSAEEK